MNYTKPTKSINVVLHGGDTVEATGAYAPLTEFEADKTMHIKGDGKVDVVPYHSVMAVEVQTVSESVTKGNPYYCEGGSGNTRGVVCESNVCEADVACE